MNQRQCRCSVVWGVVLAVIPAWANAASDNVIKGAPDALGQAPQPLNSTPAPQRSAGTFELPPVDKGTSTTAGIQVAGFRFEGNTVFTSQQLQKVVAPFVGRRLAPAELEEARLRLTRLYIDHGYINSGALLAALPGSKGFPGDVVPMRIVEGRIDDVRIKGEERLQKSYVRDRLVKGDEVFNMSELQERFRLLTLDPLFERINTRIIPGDAPGKAVLDIDIARAKPYALSAFFNNYRPPSIGAQGGGVSGWVRNLTGYGDVLDATLQHSNGSDPISLAWALPLNANGTTFRANADHGNSAVIEEPLNSIDIHSTTTGFEVGLDQALIDTLSRRVMVGLSYGERKNTTTLLGQPFSFTPGEPNGVSKVKVVRLSQEWTERWEKQALALRSVFAFGRNNVDPTAGQGTIPDIHYRIWTGQLQYVQTLMDNGAQILLRGSMQATPDRLLPLERFAIGGIGTVRGYRENSVVRDRGYAASAEFHYPLIAGGNSGHTLTLIPFIDYGSGRNQDESSQKLSSAGLGLNWRWQRLAADLYIAKKLNSLPATDEGHNLQDRGIHFQISYTLF